MKDNLKPSPPGWAVKFLRAFCAPHLVEEVEGDLEEEFHYQVRTYGLRKARLDYVRSVFGFMKPFAIQRKPSSVSNPFNMNMLRHYLVVAHRNLIRHRAFSAINVVGLALGMVCCVFILLWAADERSVDDFHANGKSLYNVYETSTTNTIVTSNYTIPFINKSDQTYIPIADICDVVPEIKAVNFYATGYELPWGYPETFQVGDKRHKFQGSRAEARFFEMFSYKVIAGRKEQALKDLSSIAISRKMAEIFFKSPEEAIGKSIRYENRIDFTVTTVFENVPVHSSLKFDFLINWESHMTRMGWNTPDFLTTLLIDENADIRRIEEKINRHVQAQLDPNDPRKIRLGLQPFNERYLYGNFANGRPDGGRITYVSIFTGVAVFILFIACINFMNLATARSLKRAKEIGVRKVVGSSRSSLIGQFLGEAVVLSFLAMVLTVGLVHLLLPAFNSFTGKEIVSPLLRGEYLLLLAVLMLVTGLVAGIYPALFLSSLRPARILKGGMKFSNSSVMLRKGLSVFQFVISNVLLIVTVVISRQTSYVQNAHLGYDKENIIYMRVEGELMNFSDPLSNQRKYTAFKERALTMPGIAMVDRSSEAPHAMGFIVDENDGKTETVTGNDAINWEGKERGTSVGFKPVSVGFDFLKIMNLQVVEGRGFSRDVASDSSDAFMVNEEAVRQMGMKDPIGKWISAWKKKGKIIGILKDYHTNSLHEPIKPLVIDVKEYEYFGVLLIRTKPEQTKVALASLEKVYKDINPNYPFSYRFMDQEYEMLYRNEQVIANLSNAFSIIAVAISCLGLLGLAIFFSEQRVREIGIRKVLGATVLSILNLLSADLLKIVVIAFLVAAPIAGYLMHEWLQRFAYRIDLSLWIFTLAGFFALFIALLTIGVQAYKSAVANPVESLKAE